jgi:hypothetical protein
MSNPRFGIINILKNAAGIISIALLLMAVGCSGTTVKNINPEEDSFVIGRVKDRMIITEEELYERGWLGKDIKIDEFELLDISSGKAYKIKMNRDGYFVQKLDQGDFVFELNMSGTGYLPSTRKEGVWELKSCTVPHRSIVNVGTFIVKSNRGKSLLPHQIKFHVQPVYGSESFSDPLAWFKSKYPDICDAYGDRIVSSK